jgi:hypothetical protein
MWLARLVKGRDSDGMLGEAMKRIWQLFQTLSRPHQAGLVFVLVLLMALFSGLVSGIRSHYQNKAFEKETAKLKAQSAADRQRGDEAEERAKAAETDKLKYQLAFELAGKDAQQAMEKVKDAETKYNQDAESINNDIDECERYNRIRAKLKLQPVKCD